jgi:uncharacterized protein (UPF0218 family)
VKLPENLRGKLKTPLGKLVQNKEVTKENIKKEISTSSFLITVGDTTTEKMLDFGIIPSMQIVDSQEKRTKRKPPENSSASTNLVCKNPAGEITDESINVIKNGFGAKIPVRITVEGEEDLLVLPVCIYAPEKAVVMYGQPNQGIVIIHVNDEVRRKTKSILDSMN